MTVEYANEFWSHIAKNYPDIDRQLSNRALVNEAIISFQPARMSNEDYDTYNRILKQWLANNGFIPSPQPDMIYVATNDSKAMGFDSINIVSLMAIDDELTEVIIKDENDINTNVIIKENIEDFKKRVYIFQQG